MNVMRDWEGINLHQSERVFLNKPGKKFKTAVLLTNIRCCFQGNLISHFFACRPPTPESYLSI
jgi:hypothetical protein